MSNGDRLYADRHLFITQKYQVLVYQQLYLAMQSILVKACEQRYILLLLCVGGYNQQHNRGSVDSSKVKTWHARGTTVTQSA